MRAGGHGGAALAAEARCTAHRAHPWPTEAGIRASVSESRPSSGKAGLPRSSRGLEGPWATCRPRPRAHARSAALRPDHRRHCAQPGHAASSSKPLAVESGRKGPLLACGAPSKHTCLRRGEGTVCSVKCREPRPWGPSPASGVSTAGLPGWSRERQQRLPRAAGARGQEHAPRLRCGFSSVPRPTAVPTLSGGDRTRSSEETDPTDPPRPAQLRSEKQDTQAARQEVLRPGSKGHGRLHE